MILRVKDFASKVGSGVTPRGGADIYLSEGIPFFRSQNITNEGLLLDDIVYISEEINESMSSTKLFKGDVLINITGASIGRCYYLPEDFSDGNVNQHVCIIRPKKNVISSFLYYNLVSKVGQDQIAFSQTGANREGLAKEDICNFLFNIPSLKEQKAIVDYLDKKTAEIDSQISLLENKQKAYEKLKQSLISEVVTCGLNPAVALKDSGIDWIGEIPVHWEVKRLKSIFSECKEISSTGNEDLLSVSEYYGVARRLDVMDEDEYDTRADSLVGYKICKKDDLVINIMLAWKRGLGFSDYDGIVSPAYAVYRGKNIVPHYYHYLLRTNKYIAEFKRNSKGIIDSRLRLYSDRFFAINTIVPPLEEQLAVADYLDKKTAEIDECISLTDKKIKAYKRLKQSLIDEVVTGKRKI